MQKADLVAAICSRQLRVLSKGIRNTCALRGTYKCKSKHIKRLYFALLIAGAVILTTAVTLEILARIYAVHYDREEYLAETAQVLAAESEKDTKPAKINSIYCSCIQTARAEGVPIPYNTDAKDLQPNSVPVVGGLVLITYPNTEHVAKILALLNDGIKIVEGLELKDGDCIKRERIIPFDYPSIRGFWAPATSTPLANVTDLIKKYSKEYGADERLALNVACAESCQRDMTTGWVYLDPEAKNPASSATGVFQFIDSTWKATCEGDVKNAEDNVKCGVKLLAAGDVHHWLASKNEGFGGGWNNDAYFKYQVIN